MNLVFGVKRQLEIVGVVNVDVSERSLLTILDDSLVLDVVLKAQLVERVGHECQAVAKNVNIDVRPFADVPGAHAADQARPESRQQPHQPQGIHPHVAQILEPLGPLVHAGHGLDLVADFAVAGKVCRAMPIFDAKLAGGLSLGGEILGFGPVIHHLRSQKRDLAANAFVGHEEVRRFEPIEAAPGNETRKRKVVRSPSGKHPEVGQERTASFGRIAWAGRPVKRQPRRSRAVD